MKKIVRFNIIIFVIASVNLLVPEVLAKENAGNPAIKIQMEQHDADIKGDLRSIIQNIVSSKEEQTGLLIDQDVFIQEILKLLVEGACKNGIGAWNKVINDPIRFETVMNSEAVLDKETCLVWERHPDEVEQIPIFDVLIPVPLAFHCANLVKGGRKGWRPPTVEELTSLIDLSQTLPALPQNNPFIDIQSQPYLTSSSNPLSENGLGGIFGTETGDFTVSMADGNLGSTLDETDSFPLAWCVRGGTR